LRQKSVAYTLVTAFESSLPARLELSPADGSIKAARWMAMTADLHGFAPANRLILGHQLWSHLSEVEQQTLRAPIAQALAACAVYAVEASVTPPPAPWASSAEILEWSSSWPQTT
jgi:hypothetical protein